MKTTLKVLSVLLSLCLIAGGLLGCKKEEATETVTSQTLEISSKATQSDDASSKNSTSKKKTPTSKKQSTSKTKTSTSKKQTTTSKAKLSEREIVLKGLDEELYAKSLDYAGNSTRIANLMKKCEQGGTYTLGFIGGSITYGAGASKLETSYSSLVKDWWVQNFPQATFKFVNVGIGGTNTVMASYRIEDDLLVHNPDFVIVDFAVNSSSDPDVLNSYSTILYKVMSLPNSPGVMAVHFTNTNSKKYNAGLYEKNANYPSAGIATAVRNYQVPSINYHNYVWEKLNTRTIMWPNIGADYVHPNDNGHLITATMINKHLEYVKANLDSLVGTPPAINPPKSDFYMNYGYITTGTAGVTANGFTKRDTGGRAFNCWVSEKTGDTISFTAPAGEEFKIFINMSSCQGALIVEVNGVEQRRIETKDAKVPKLIDIYAIKAGDSVVLKSEVEKGKLYFFGVCYTKP